MKVLFAATLFTAALSSPLAVEKRVLEAVERRGDIWVGFYQYPYNGNGDAPPAGAVNYVNPNYGQCDNQNGQWYDAISTVYIPAGTACAFNFQSDCRDSSPMKFAAGAQGRFFPISGNDNFASFICSRA